MFGTLNFGIRAFVVGLFLGVLFAPRAGTETRRLLRERFESIIDSIAELVTAPSEPIELPERTETSRRRRASSAS
jgi:hypothetical protein